MIDLGVFIFAVFLGYLLRFNFDIGAIAASNLLTGASLFVIAGLASTIITRSYSGIIRYTGFQDAVRILVMVSLASLICTISNIINTEIYGKYLIPYSVLVIAFMASVMLLVNYRIMIKYVFAYSARTKTIFDNVLIFGAGESGQTTCGILHNAPDTNVRVVGYLEDDLNKTGKILNGIKIYPGDKNLSELLTQLAVSEIIISVQYLSIERKEELISVCIKQGVKVKHVPPVHRWVHGELNPHQIREVKIEDLLGRDTIKLNNYYVNKELSDKRIIITGAAGSIGSEILRQVILYNPSMIILLDQWESGLFDTVNEINRVITTETIIISKVIDITNENRVRTVFETYKPDIVFHAAAYKHVPLMENNPAEAILCNVGGTKVLADLAVANNTSKFVMISTDKAVNPTSVMGASKRIAEMYVQSLNNLEVESKSLTTRFVTTRFGNVLGSNGSVIPVFEEQIRSGGPITVTHPEITRYFMTIPEACQLVLEAGAMGKGGEIFIFDMGRSIKIVDLAKKMIQLSGYEEGKDVEIVYTGLREGEKLHEELLTTKESDTPTYHEKIKIAKIEKIAYFKIAREIEVLIDKASKDDDYQIVEIMKKIVPEFISNASRFEKLDKVSVNLNN